MTLGSALFQKLSSQELITPYLENALLDDRWPDHIKIPFKEHDSVKDDYFHPSSHCFTPARQLYYMLHPVHRQELIQERFTVPSIMSMTMGSILHVIIQEKMKMHGLLGDEHIEIPLLNEQHHGRGRMDLKFPSHPMKGKDIPVDIKTASPDSFEYMRKPSDGYEAQMQCYMDWDGGHEEGVILVVEAGRPYRMKEFRVTRNEEMLNEIYSRWDYVRECITLGTPPPACCSVGTPKYKGCPARVTCIVNEGL